MSGKDVALNVWSEEREPEQLALVTGGRRSFHDRQTAPTTDHRMGAAQPSDQDRIGARGSATGNDQTFAAAQRNGNRDLDPTGLPRRMDDGLAIGKPRGNVSGS
ncbi:MAG: hypothetical protein ABIQ32_11625 [Sphingomicrobium sp.]